MIDFRIYVASRRPPVVAFPDDRRFSALLRAISDHVYRMSPDWSDVRDLGLPESPDYQTGGRHWLDQYVHPEDRARLAPLVAEAIREKSVFEAEHRHLRPDSGGGWLLTRAVPLMDETGLLLEWFGASFDITGRKEAEEASRRSEARYRALFENMIDGVAYCRLVYDDTGAAIDFEHLAANPAFERVTGLQGIVGRRAGEVIPGIHERIPVFLETFARVAAGGPAERFEVFAMDRWLDVAAVRAGEGHVMAIFEDISERRRAGQHIRSEKQRLEAVLETLPVAVFIVEGPEGIISYVNPRAEEVYGFRSVGLTIEKNMAVVRPKDADGSPRTIERLPAYRGLHGEHVRNEEMVLERPDGITFHVLASASPLPAGEGRSPGAVVAFADITELRGAAEALHRSEERLRQELRLTRTLVETAGAIAQWPDLRSVLLAITEAVVKSTAHTRATFALWDEVRREIEIVASSGEEPMQPFRAPLEQFSPAFQRVVATMQTAVVDYDTVPAERKKVAVSLRSQNALLVPLVYHGRLIGGLHVDDPGKWVQFSQEEVALIEGIAAQAAVAVENARLYDAQSNIADTLQQALLQLPEEIPGIRFSHLYRSADQEASIGGDFYDLIRLRNGACIALIGDVSGHGIEAARWATFVRDAVAAFASAGRKADEILADTNRALLERSVKFFVSALVAVLAPDRRHLSFCSAGHPNFLLRRHTGETTMVAAQNAPPLGVFSDWSCASSEVQLAAGDTMVFYTDGVTEARKGWELFGEARLIEWLQYAGAPLSGLSSALLDEVLAFTGGALQDDVAVMAVEIGSGR